MANNTPLEIASTSAPQVGNDRTSRPDDDIDEHEDPALAFIDRAEAGQAFEGDEPQSEAKEASSPIESQGHKMNALFAFDDPEMAQAAHRTLLSRGLKTEDIQVRAGVAKGKDKPFAQDVDEQLTGGLLTNMRDLFQGVFDWGASPHPDTASYEEIIRLGGTVLSVDSDNANHRTLVDEAMQHANCASRTAWAG